MVWDDPKADRRKPLSKGGSGWIFPILMAVVITAIGLVLIADPRIGGWQTRFGKQHSAPATVERLPVVPPEEAIGPTVRPRQVLQPSFTTSRRPEQHSVTGPSGDAAVMRKLMETCNYWRSQNVNGKYDGTQALACNEASKYASKYGFAVPGPDNSQLTRSPTTRALRSIPSLQDRSPIIVFDCEGAGYGSIAYRKCRSREKARLTAQCKGFREQLEIARGDTRNRLRDLAAAACREADRYAIVN